jgi:RimJ/RimL family protein N-acetyltransferase
MEAWVEARRSAASVSLVETTEALVGLLFLFRPDTAREGDPMHLGYMLGEESWGQGYGSELISGLIEHLEPGPRSDLQAGVDIHNHASARILLKTGFVRAPEYCSQELDVYERSVGRAPVLDVSQTEAVK